MSNERIESWERFKAAQLGVRENGGDTPTPDCTSFMAGWSCRANQAPDTDEQLALLAEQVVKLTKLLVEPRITTVSKDEQAEEYRKTRAAAQRVNQLELDRIPLLEAALRYPNDTRSITSQTKFDYDTWAELCRKAGVEI